MAALALGWVMDAGFEQLLVLYNPAVYSTGDIIDTWVYRVGLLGLQFSVGAAVGLFKGVISLILICPLLLPGRPSSQLSHFLVHFSVIKPKRSANG